MKPLSIESIRNGAHKAPSDLTTITKGFQAAVYSIAKVVSGWTSMPLTLTIDNLVTAKVNFEETSDADGYGISRLLNDPETGISLRLKLDKDFVQKFSEAVFGGDVIQVGDHESRPLSQIEKDVGQIFIKVVVEKLAEAFVFPKDTKFIFEVPAEKNQVIEKAVFKPQITAKLNAQFGTHCVGFTCDLPTEFIVRANVTAPKVTSTKTEVNPSWVRTINNVLEPTEIELIAVLTELQLKLSTVSNLRIGQTIPLDVNYKSSLKIQSGEIDLYSAHLGQSNGNYCVFIDGLSDPSQLNSEQVTSSSRKFFGP
jgi:flagellar motor switch protein FliM